MSNTARKQTGSYYTPSALVEELLDAALDPMLDELKRAGRSPLSIRILDPACGDGAFLVAALDRLTRAAGGEPVATRTAALDCLEGMDADEGAVAACRRRLADAAGVPPDIVSNITCGDSLLNPPTEWKQGTFDCIIGNPPFLHAIERTHRRERRRLLAKLHPELGGTADEAYHFLAHAMRLARSDGRIGFVLPRTMLVAKAAGALRDSCFTGRYPRYIHPLEDDGWFPGSHVYVCLLALGPAGLCTAVTDDGRRMSGDASGVNWWREWLTILGEAGPVSASGPTAGDVFDVRAGMTVSDAYVIGSTVHDDPAGTGLKLVTTGLVEPYRCLWGEKPARYLGRTYLYPRIAPNADGGAALVRRLNEARRPKVIVAGLSRRIECFLDVHGEHAGAVATFAIFHPKDDIDALRCLCERLLTDEATHLFRCELGATALSRGSTRMTKDFLRNLPWDA